MLNYQKNLERYIRHRIVCEMKYSLVHLLIKERIFSKVIDELVFHYSNIIKSDNFEITRYFPYCNNKIRPIYNVENYISNIVNVINTTPTLSKLLNLWYWVDSIHNLEFWDYYYKHCKILNQKLK